MSRTQQKKSLDVLDPDRLDQVAGGCGCGSRGQSFNWRALVWSYLVKQLGGNKKSGGASNGAASLAGLTSGGLPGGQSPSTSQQQ